MTANQRIYRICSGGFGKSFGFVVISNRPPAQVEYKLNPSWAGALLKLSMIPTQVGQGGVLKLSQGWPQLEQELDLTEVAPAGGGVGPKRPPGPRKGCVRALFAHVLEALGGLDDLAQIALRRKGDPQAGGPGH
jgi:hypothetical protein